jgi:hypothetical protein
MAIRKRIAIVGTVYKERAAHRHVLQVVLQLFCRKYDLVLELRRMCCLFNIMAPIDRNRHRQKRNAFPRLVEFNIGNLLLPGK